MKKFTSSKTFAIMVCGLVLVLFVVLQTTVYVLFVLGEKRREFSVGSAVIIARISNSSNSQSKTGEYVFDHSRGGYFIEGPGSRLDCINVWLSPPSHGKGVSLLIRAEGIGYFWYPAAWLHASFSGAYKYGEHKSIQPYYLIQ